jgi:hypothetical protein
LSVARRSDVIAAERRFNIIEGIANLRCQGFARRTMYDVLILAFGKFGSPAKHLPEPYRWYMSNRFASHEVFDSGGQFSVHGRVRNSPFITVRAGRETCKLRVGKNLFSGLWAAGLVSMRQYET